MLISWNTTQACNLTCVHCYREAGAKSHLELSTAEGKKLIREISQAGFKIMIFSGGEPLMRPDIYELIRFAKEQGLRPVLGTNGTLLTADAVQRLKEAGAMRVGISLDSLDAAKHNRFRGCEEAWQLTMAGIANCKRYGLDFQIHTTVTTYNEGEILDILDWCVQSGAKGHHIFFLVPTGRGKDIEDTSLHTEAYEALLEAIMEKQKTVPIEIKPTCAPQFMRVAEQKGMKLRYTRGCLAGIRYCIINPWGEVQACPYLPLTSGNVKDQSFVDIWQNDNLFTQFRQERPRGSCGVCKYYENCGGCRARAYYYNDGDYLAEEPWCKYSSRKG